MSTKDDENYRDSSLNSLIAKCRQETASYLRREKNDPASCFEIWRRALQDRDHAAWEALYANYHLLVRRWLQNHIRRRPTVPFDEEALVNGVFIRAFRFITPAKFEDFPNLARLLEYLKTCCLTEVLDAMRSFEAETLDVPLEGKTNPGTGSDSEPTLIRQFASSDDVEKTVVNLVDSPGFWQVVKRHLPEKADQVAIYSRFVLQIPPREIAKLYPGYFPDEKTIHRCLKNALWRLRKDTDLKVIFNDL